MTEEKTRVLYDPNTKRYIAVTEQEFEAALKEQHPEEYKKFKNDQLLGTNYKEKLQKIEERKYNSEKREGESDLQYVKRLEADRMQREAEEFSKTHETKEDIERKQQSLLEEAKRSEQLHEQQFLGETQRHREIRTRVYEINSKYQRASPSEKQKLDEERLKLLTEYRQTHYEAGIKNFRPIIMFESADETYRIFSKDGGRTWTINEVQQGNWVRGSKKLILNHEGKPVRMTEYFENLGLHDFYGMGVDFDFLLNLLERVEEPKHKHFVKCPKCSASNSIELDKCAKCGTALKKDKQ